MLFIVRLTIFAKVLVYVKPLSQIKNINFAISFNNKDNWLIRLINSTAE